jgi:hypothetical protein
MPIDHQADVFVIFRRHLLRHIRHSVPAHACCMRFSVVIGLVVRVQIRVFLKVWIR